MIVTGARVYLARAGTLHPILLELITDQGIVGVGEAGVAYGHGGSAAAAMVKELVDYFVIGKASNQIEFICSEIYDHSFWTKGGGPVIFAAIAAIETALWDIKGKALGVPVYEMLGGRVRDEVRVYANGWWLGCETPEEFAQASKQAVSDGYDALKFYPLAFQRTDANSRSGRGVGAVRHVSRRMADGRLLEMAYARVAAVREAIGPGIDLMVDLSGALTPAETIRLCRRWEPFNLLFVEEPADPFDLPALRQVSQNIGIPVAAGERFYTRYGFRDVFESRAIDIAQPSIANTGGIMETKKIAAMAEAYSLRVQPHTAYSPVSTSVAINLDACIPNFFIQELYPYRPPEFFSLVTAAPESTIVNGRIPVPTAPGIGVELNRDIVDQFLSAETGTVF